MERAIVIAGAGIGGLTLAAALRGHGIDCLVLERAPTFAPIGAGITVEPNALRALRPLGLEEAVLAAGQPLDDLRIRHWRGATLSRSDASAFPRLFGARMVGIHRAELHRVLLAAAGEDRVRLGFEAASYEDAGDGITLAARTGETASGPLLVGADGLNSAVRAQLLGSASPRYAGYTSWRGVTPRADLVAGGATSESWGPGARFGIVPIGGGRVYWFATANEVPGGTDASLDLLLERFGRWHAPIPALLRATPPAAVLRTDISDRPAAQRWGEGRVTLLGDAAHPMTPNLGQGGCQAIEDAVVLAGELRRSGAAAEALRSYERKRIARAHWVVEEARRLGDLGQWTSAPARALRDLLVRLAPASSTLRRLARLYDFDP